MVSYGIDWIGRAHVERKRAHLLGSRAGVQAVCRHKSFSSLLGGVMLVLYDYAEQTVVFVGEVDAMGVDKI